ncbi:MAG: FAD-binding protein [Fimbriimonadaceae bacterium]|nr:FAD-binding protein [Fimbriimonadaceae bacterium]
MKNFLLIAFDPDDALQGAGFAQSVGGGFDLLLLTGEGSLSLGAEKVMTTNWETIPPADSLATGLLALCQGYGKVAAVSSMRSKDVLARLAGLLDCAMVTDVIAIAGEDQYVRPMVAGSILATVAVRGDQTLFTVRPAGFPTQATDQVSEAEPLDLPVAGKTSRLSESAKKGGRPDLAMAKVVVSGGKPLGDAATFEQVIGGLADKLGGAVGATRAAVDSGIAANELQVGQTGKIVAPDLYIAAGISGSTQHMAGIKDSKLIVAINKDPDAPIFEMADIGLVADLFQAVPELTSKV